MKSLLVYLAIVIGGVGLDQWIKYLVETGLDMHTMVDVLPFLALYRTHNTGIAFSLFSGMGSLPLVLLTLAVTALVAWLALKSSAEQVFARVGFSLIIAGAIGNLIDRIWLGYVVDYVLFHLPGWSFAIFNLADAFITVGAVMVVLDEFLTWRREKRARSGT